jgi:hypothetical protein
VLTWALAWENGAFDMIGIIDSLSNMEGLPCARLDHTVIRTIGDTLADF